ncbi:MAG: hypothetical protein IT462_16775 [Planctomycetes bacterium]|nr:hypothetical protein [Planctomycetota bacterium]
MSNERDGSKAMTVYIIICFTLALAAGVGYKLMNDRREELIGDYPSLRKNIQEIDSGGGRGLLPSVANYYELVRSGEIQQPSEDDKRDIPIYLAEIAAKLQLADTTGPQDQIDIPTAPQSNAQPSMGYMDFTLDVVLKGVSQSQWNQFLIEVKDHPILKRYVSVTKLTIQRTEDNYAKITVGDGFVDGTRWKVTFTLTWYSALKPKEQPAAPKTA